MTITGTSSYIRVKLDDKYEIVIEGELIIGGFIALKTSIKNWDPPYDKKMLSQEDKKLLIEKIENETKESHMVISFE